MLAIIGFLIKYRKYIAVILAILAAAALLSAWRVSLINQGIDQGKAEINALRVAEKAQIARVEAERFHAQIKIDNELAEDREKVRIVYRDKIITQYEELKDEIKQNPNDCSISPARMQHIKAIIDTANTASNPSRPD